ncbi:hypothetical protein EV122DRAFT_279317 [Schizophyllum commune]
MAAFAMSNVPESSESSLHVYDSDTDEESIDKKKRTRSQGKSANPYDYEQKYAEDAYGEELGANARFWHVLLDEAQTYDADLVTGWRDTLDVLLVFTGLFSAVVTTFVVQSSQALQPDYAQISVTLLAEMMALQRAWASGSSIDDVPRSSLALDAVTASSLDYWCNGLWYTSLALSMSAALIAVLVKQWLLAYNSNVSGTPKHQALARQFRLIGVERWNVPLIVGLLPMLLHVSLLLFFVGLALYVFTLDSAIAWVVVALAVTVYALYLLANVLPMLDSQCPYKTPLSQYGYIVLRHLLDKVLGWIDRAGLEELPDPSTRSPRARSWILRLVAPLARMFSLSSTRTPRAREANAIARSEKSLQIECLSWVHVTSSNPSAISITVQAISGLPADFTPHRLQHDDLFRETLSRLWTLMQALDDEDANSRERLTRGLLFLDVPQEQMSDFAMITHAALIGVDHQRDTAELQAAVLALTVDVHHQDALRKLTSSSYPGALDDLLAIPFIHVSSPKALRLQPAVWYRILPYLRFVELSPAAAVHLGIYLWRHIEGDRSSDMTMTSLWTFCDFENLSDAPENDLRLEFLLTIHGLVCKAGCAESANIVTVRDLLPHMLQSALKSLARAAIEVEADTIITADQRSYHAKLHLREVRFLHTISLSMPGLSIVHARQLLKTVIQLAKVSFWSIQSRAELLNLFSPPPGWAVGPLLQSFAYLLNHSGRSRVYPVFLHMTGVFDSCPHEALDATLKHDILAAVWPHLDLIVAEGGEYISTFSLNQFAELLSPYFRSIGQLPAYDDKVTHADYLTRIADNVTEPETTPPRANHLTWCVLVDILVTIGSSETSTDSLHSNILQFARQTSRSHAQAWMDVLSSITTHWRNVRPAVGATLRTECGRQTYRDLVDAISPGLAAVGLVLPELELGDANGRDADRVDGREEGMGNEPAEDVAEAKD